MQIDVSAQQFENSDSLISVIVEPDSNVTAFSFSQCAKPDCPMVTTEAGMQIEAREEQSLKAAPSRTETIEPGAKISVRSAFR
jgi:hypothetical protein